MTAGTRSILVADNPALVPQVNPVAQFFYALEWPVLQSANQPHRLRRFFFLFLHTCSSPMFGEIPPPGESYGKECNRRIGNTAAYPGVMRTQNLQRKICNIEE